MHVTISSEKNVPTWKYKTLELWHFQENKQEVETQMATDCVLNWLVIQSRILL